MTLKRRDAVARLLRDRENLLVVTGLGSPSYDTMAAGDHDGNFYIWSAMGSAAMTGLGLALAQPDSPVLVITGDGEQLMGLGGLATVAVAGPKNLTVAVLNNGRYGETGMQASHTARGVDLAAVAKGCGIADSRTVTDTAGIDALRSIMGMSGGPLFADIVVEADDPPRVLPPRDGIYLKNRFRAALGYAPI
jgi:thiamine pyrophosphate-dependent acetolactate synthase large subunit-like protein